MMTDGRRLRLGMVGGGEGAFIGAVHRMAARIDDQWELVAGAFQSDPKKSIEFGQSLGLAADRCYGDFGAMARAEAGRADRIDAVAIVTPNHMHFAPAMAFLESGIAVICDKPLTVSTEQAEAMAAAVARTGLPFILTHNYTGYPMVRQAREMIAAGELGALRIIQAEYVQDWLARDLSGNKQASWRTDPARAGPGGALGDIATHAFQLAEFMSGLEVESVLADLASFVTGRALDDNVHALLRYKGGAKGQIWASQAAPGNANGLRLRIYGARGGLEWAQETPEDLIHAPLGEPPRRLRRGGPGLGEAALRATRIPQGHPEGYLEGFAQIYTDAAELIRAHSERRSPHPLSQLAPGVRDGVRGVRFVTAAVTSHNAGGVWTRLD